MGYTTTFKGVIAVEPPLNPQEIAYLRRFARSRRMDRERGPYYCGDGEDEDDILDHDEPPPGQPGLWCKWEPTDDGRGIAWNKAEKFYEAQKWMAYLVRTFLVPGAALAAELAAPVPGRHYAPEFAHFTFDHVVNGLIKARGEDRGDAWHLVVLDGEVFVRRDGEQTGPITDTDPTPPPDFASFMKPFLLLGGPHDGERPLQPPNVTGMELPDGTRYAIDPKAPAGSDVTEEGGRILRFQEG